jgi:hypothetical protein
MFKRLGIQFFIIILQLNVFAIESDCTLIGSGTVYIFNLESKAYEPNNNYSWKMEAKRYSIGNGLYQIVETKTFNSGRSSQQTTFQIQNFIGKYDFSAPDGSLKSVGFCSQVGHCFGDLIIKGENFIGRKSTQFDSTGIRTVTYTSNGAYVDEVLTPVNDCKLNFD